MSATQADTASASDARRLFVLGFLTLFLELALIRFLAGSVWNLGYFPNLVLLGVFVGMGCGFVFHGVLGESRSRIAFAVVPLGLLALGLFVLLLRPVVPGFGNWGGTIGGEVYYSASPSQSDSGSVHAFAIWFLAIVAIFGLVSQRTAKLFRCFAPLRAYTLDIGGSCAGILAFMACSALELPAWTWFVLLVPGFVIVQQRRQWQVALPLVVLAGLVWHADTRLTSNPAFQGELAVRWSPYQKVEYASGGAIFVNGIAHQTMVAQDAGSNSIYALPYRYRAGLTQVPPYRSVLVIGAGSGNDVAMALLHGAEHVDAVEIDPAIARFGALHHPLHPYADPRVSLHVTDGRAFMTQTRRRYDLIVFALTDSLVKVSPMSQLRLENYLFTVESVRRAFTLLSGTGDLVLYNYYRQPWIVQKNHAMILAATGTHARTLWAHDDFAMLMVGRQTHGEAPPSLAGVDVATDDWPFPYLREHGIPELYRWAMAGVACLVALLGALVHRWGSASATAGLRTKLAFLFMGVAFLLLETKGVIQFSLLFGTTWLNNSLVFLAVLVLVLLANWIAQGIHDRRLLGVAYVVLMALCLLTLWYPLAGLLQVQSVWWRFVLASLLTFSPVFCANLIFSVAFREQALPEHVFGWNLIGAALGGVLEYTGMALGYNALALVVAGCYTLVVLLLVSERPAGVAPA